MAKFRPLSWRLTHGYIVGDRFEDLTDPLKVQEDPTVDRDVVLYGYLRGNNLKEGATVSQLWGGGGGTSKLTFSCQTFVDFVGLFLCHFSMISHFCCS